MHDHVILDNRAFLLLDSMTPFQITVLIDLLKMPETEQIHKSGKLILPTETRFREVLMSRETQYNANEEYN